MLIEDTGIYNTRNFASAEDFAMRGPNCIGYIVQPDGTKAPKVWLIKDGTENRWSHPTRTSSCLYDAWRLGISIPE